MLILMNLAKDFDEMVTENLIKQGYQVNKNDTPGYRFCILFEHSARLIPQVPHQVKVSRELLENPKYYLLKPVIKEITDLIRQGKDSRPYLSTRVPKLAKNGRDHLLTHWGIRHFHLSPLSTRRPDGFVARADELLFVRIHQNTAYLIDILPHAQKNVFEEKHLLEIVDRNWPHLHIQVSDIRADRELSKEEIKALRRKNLTHMENVNGRIIMPTLGSSLAGTPDEATVAFNRNWRELRWLEANIRRHYLEYFSMCTWQWMAHVRLLGVWEKGFDIWEASTNQTRRVRLRP